MAVGGSKAQATRSKLPTTGNVRTKEKVDESLKKKRERQKKSFKSHIAQDKHMNSVSIPIYG